MVAFNFFGFPVYWYGILYLISFVGFFFRCKILARQKLLPTILQKIFSEPSDLIIYLFFGVLLGGRLGHVLIYDPTYYISYPLKIFFLWEGGMSFVGGVIGVVVALLRFRKRFFLGKKLFFLLLDCLAVFLPLGIFFGRIGNFLNQELIGKQISALGELGLFIYSYGFSYTYYTVDSTLRVNTNLLEGLVEGIFLMVVLQTFFWRQVKKKNFFVGMISGIFLFVYGVARFFLEFLRDNPATEFVLGVNKTQIFMVFFMIFGTFLLIRSNKYTINLITNGKNVTDKP